MALAGDLNLLHALRALLEDRNVTHAGTRIGMSQPAMSSSLARLRRHFKDELLVRVGRDYELTPLAQTLLPLVQETLHLAERTLEVRPVFDPGTVQRTFTVVLSDYALTVLGEPLLEIVGATAPRIRIDFRALPDDLDLDGMDRLVLRRDLVIGPVGHGITGTSEVVFSDRFVCLVDRDNPRLEGGKLTLDTLTTLPHAATNFGRTTTTPVDRRLAELGVERRIEVGVQGFLALPFLVAGTDLVAFVPERLACRFRVNPRLRVAEPPIDRIDLVESMFWHPSRDQDLGHQWLRSIVRESAARLPPVVEAGDR